MKDNDIQMKNEKAVVASMDEMRDQKLAYFRELMKCRKKLKPFREQESLNPGAMGLIEQYKCKKIIKKAAKNFSPLLDL